MAVKNEKELVSIIEMISKEKIGYGNNHLYSMCQEPINSQMQWSLAEILGDRMALIGRSYAASPERRYRWKKDTPEEAKELKVSGNGTGDFFYNIAEYMIKNASQDLKQIQQDLQDKKYNFDYSKEDLQLLKQTVHAVRKLNMILLQAILEYDKKNNAESVEYMDFRNQISFCTKFLHFHFPDAFFIIDSFSKESAKYLFSTKCKTNVVLKYKEKTTDIINVNVKEKGLVSLLETDNSETNCWKDYETFSSIKEVDENTYHEYLMHCEFAYKLGTIVHHFTEPKEIYSSMPRIVDTILLHVSKDK